MKSIVATRKDQDEKILGNGHVGCEEFLRLSKLFVTSLLQMNTLRYLVDYFTDAELNCHTEEGTNCVAALKI